MQINPDIEIWYFDDYGDHVSIVSIHADQSRPLKTKERISRNKHAFQSYQCMQINPDKAEINLEVCVIVFQSYQFMQINPDIGYYITKRTAKAVVSIVSIHADQSRPVVEVL